MREISCHVRPLSSLVAMPSMLLTTTAVGLTAVSETTPPADPRIGPSQPGMGPMLKALTRRQWAPWSEVAAISSGQPPAQQFAMLKDA